MNYTENYGLTQYEELEKFRITQESDSFNHDMEIIDAVMKAHEENAGDEYDPDGTYAVGDLCIHENRLKRCTVAIETAEAWNDAHWEDTTLAAEIAGKMGNPTNSGEQGQLLQNDGNGGAEWSDAGTPSDAQVEAAVDAWLDAHPEATTTVQDGAISRAKLDADLKAKTDAVADLTSAIEDVNDALAAIGLVIYNGQFYINPDGNSLSA